MTKIYEGMFLLDNEVVRQDWKRAKELVTGTLEKHGATVRAARRWDERRLAYPIKGRRRATYLLAYYEIPGAGLLNLRRDFDLSEPVLRYLLTTTESIPDKEVELSEVEKSDTYVAPPPPTDDAPEVQERGAALEDELIDELDEDLGGRRGPRRRGSQDVDEDLDIENAEKEDE